MRILLVEDEADAAQMIAKGLRENTYAVDVASDGEAALYQAEIKDYDLIILDVMLPRRDGLEVCRSLREAGSSTPILMLSARDAVADRVRGLDAGADDYVTKPFDFGELLARIRALLRRGPLERSETIVIGDLSLDTSAHRVYRSNKEISLTTREYVLLEYLARNAEQVVGQAQLFEHVLDKPFEPSSDLIEVYLQRLRRKIGDEAHNQLIRTVRGKGYLITSKW